MGVVLLLNQIGKKISPEVKYSGRNLELSTRRDESSAKLIEEEMMKMQGNVCVEVFPTIVTMQGNKKMSTTNLENSMSFVLAA